MRQTLPIDHLTESQQTSKYRHFVIAYDPPPIPIRGFDWEFVHEDYDGPNDNRCGRAGSLEEAMATIDELSEATAEVAEMARLHPVCPDCGRELVLSISYSGCDWNCEAGEGSGFGYEVGLWCKNDGCARVFPLGMIKNHANFSPYKEVSGKT